MPEESPGSPATADGLGTNGNVNDAEMRDSTERTAAADAAAKEEAIKLAAEVAAREELAVGGVPWRRAAATANTAAAITTRWQWEAVGG